MSLPERVVNGLIRSSRELTAIGSYRKALKYNRRAIKIMCRLDRIDPNPFAALVNQSTLARLYYEQAGVLHQLGAGEPAVAAARFAEHLHTDIDPTRGYPERVEETIQEFRRKNKDGLAEFEYLIGNAANARSYLALMLALYKGRASTETAQRLCSNAVRTYEELTRVSRFYGPEDLRHVLTQVNQTQQLLSR